MRIRFRFFSSRKSDPVPYVSEPMADKSTVKINLHCLKGQKYFGMISFRFMFQ